MRKSKNRYFYHIFVSPGDAPEVITLNVVWMEREFDAYKLSRCMCPSNYYRFWDTARYLWKNRPFIIPPCIRRYIQYNRSSACRQRRHCRCHSVPKGVPKFRREPPTVRGFPSEYRYPLWDGITRMVSLPDGEKISKISLFVLTWSTNVTDKRTDRQTLHGSKDCGNAYASRGKNYEFQ